MCFYTTAVNSFAACIDSNLLLLGREGLSLFPVRIFFSAFILYLSCPPNPTPPSRETDVSALSLFFLPFSNVQEIKFGQDVLLTFAVKCLKRRTSLPSPSFKLNLHHPCSLHSIQQDYHCHCIKMHKTWYVSRPENTNTCVCVLRNDIYTQSMSTQHISLPYADQYSWTRGPRDILWQWAVNYAWAY